MGELMAEWIPYLNAYRLFNRNSPQWTVAYEEDLDEAGRMARENGYDGIILCEEA